MNQAAKGVLQFAIIGLIMAGAVVAVFEAANPFPKEGKIAVYFAYAVPQVGIQGNQYMVTQTPPATGEPPDRPNVLSLEVTIDSVRVHRGISDDETAWTEISSGSVTIDLMKPSGESILLGSANIAEQNITMVRMHVTRATATIQNSSGTFPGQIVTVSSGEFKIPVTAQIRGQLTTSITVSPESVHTVIQGNGEIRATPVLHIQRVDGPE